LPVKTKFIDGCEKPRTLDIFSCVIMAAIFSYILQCVKHFITNYNYSLQHIDFITNYSIESVIKGGVM
jgi:hypothetical protein